MKKALTVLLISVLALSLLCGCEPDTPMDPGLSQAELWQKLALNEGEAWSDVDTKYYVVLGYADGRFEFNQYNANGKYVRNTGTTREFKYAGNDTYTFIVDYPAQSGFQTLSKNVTIVYAPMAQYNVQIQMYNDYDTDAGILPVSKVSIQSEQDLIDQLWTVLASVNSWSTFDKSAPNDISYMRFYDREDGRYVNYAGTFNEIWEEEKVNAEYMDADGSVNFSLNSCVVNIRMKDNQVVVSTDNTLIPNGTYTADYKSFLPINVLWDLLKGDWSKSDGQSHYGFTVEGGTYYVTFINAKGTPTKASVPDGKYWAERYRYTVELSNGRIVTVETVFNGDFLEKILIESSYDSGTYFNGKG